MLVRKPNPNPTVHNYSTYINHRCRCEICRAANTAYVLARRAKARARRLLVEAGGGRYVAAGITHGAGSYRNHACRCEVCRTAHNEAAARYARRARQIRREAS